MSSTKEAPGITNNPAADNTDSPNFGQFGDDVLYEIHVDNNGDAESDITYQRRVAGAALADSVALRGRTAGADEQRRPLPKRNEAPPS